MADPSVRQLKKGPSGPVRPWSSFLFPDFSLLWLSGIATMLAMQLRIITTGQWIYDNTVDPKVAAALLGGLGAVQLIQMPAVIYGGALADVVDRKKLMAMTQAASFLSLLALALLSFTDTLAVWHLFVITAFVGVFNMLGNSARPALLPRVLPRRFMTNGVTIQTASFQVAGIGVPLVWVVLYDGPGVTITFLVAAAIAALSFLSPLFIRASGKPEGGSRRVTLGSLKEGFLFVRSHRILPGLYLLDVGVTIVSFYRELFPVFADGLYGRGAEGTAALRSANAVGGAGGSFIVFFTGGMRYKGRIVLVATLAYAVLLIAFGLNPIFLVGLLIVAALGLVDSIGMTMRQAVVQLTTPDKLLGRASSAHSFSAMGANSLGQLEVGLMAGLIGAGPTMIVGGAVSLVVVGLIWWLVPGVRRYRYEETASDGELPP